MPTPPPPDPNLVVRAAGAAARRRALAALARLGRGRLWAAPDLMRRELLRLEPVLARALTDAQLVAFLAAARRLALAAVPAPAPTAVPGGPPPAPHFPDRPDDPEPVVRFPALEAAAADLAGRRAVAPAEFAALHEDARRSAFTVARAATLDAVEKVRDALAGGIGTGGSAKSFRAKARAALGESALADHQLDALHRTHEARAAAAGQRAVLAHPMVADEFPYLVWSATHDGRVRPDHLAMETAGPDGTAVYRADDPIWEWAYPPCGWHCRCVVFPLSVADAAGYGCREARAWHETGEPPAAPRFVKSVPIELPRGWEPTGRRLVAAV